MRLITPLVVVALLVVSTPAHASAITLDIFSAPGETLTAPNGGTASVTTTSDQILGGTRHAVYSFGGAPFYDSYTIGFGTGTGGDYYLKSATLLLTWDAGGAGLNLDATPYGGVFWRGRTTDGSGVVTLRFFTSPTDLFFLQRCVCSYAPIGDAYRAPAEYHEGIYPYSYFTVIGNPDWAQIHTIQAEILLRSSDISVSGLRLTSLPESVPDGGSTLALLAMGLVTLVGVAARQRSA